MYINLTDIRAEGIPVTTLSDDRAEFLSEGWQAWFEAKTGNWFEAKTKTLSLDGDGSRILSLNVPIISITELYTNGDFTTALDSELYVVYNRYYPDDRRNPKIVLAGDTNDFFSPSGGVFNVGNQNQKVIGSFGYVEEDGSVPFPVCRAIMTLIVLSSENMGDGEIDILRGGRVVEEVTDRHRIRFANLFNDLGQWSPSGIADVDEALKMYRRPAIIRSPRTW